MPEFRKAARTGGVPPGKSKLVVVDGLRIALFRDAGGGFHAIDDACPHMGGPLSDGDLCGTVVTCPWHAWPFDVTSGMNPDEPEIAVPRHPVRVEGEDVWIQI